MPKNDSTMPAVHPVIDKLLPTDDATPPKAVSGYVGRSSRDGYVLVYPSLRTLDRSYQIAAADILHTEPIPESIKPFGATMFWLKPDAIVGFRHVNTGDSSQGGAPQPPTPPPFNAARIGRLMMQTPMLNPSAPPPEQYLSEWQAFHCTCSECSVCMSHCDNSCSS
jgi:hypothetical protein